MKRNQPVMATAVPKKRLLELVKARCALFHQTFNPQNIRTGNKILRQRLRGPALVSYYPPRAFTYKNFSKLLPNLETYDEEEAERIDRNVITRARGKGPPKKKRTAQESKKFYKKKPLASAAKPAP